MRNILSFFMMFGLFGCVDHHTSDLNEFVNTEMKKTYPIHDEIPKLVNVELMKFTQGTGRNPFSIPRAEVISPIKNTPVSCPQPDFERKKQALEMYSLNNLQMKGTLQNDDALTALIQSPDGKIHQLNLADYIGLNYGKVLTIEQNKVKLMELAANKDGCWHERMTQITLHLK